MKWFHYSSFERKFVGGPVICQSGPSANFNHPRGKIIGAEENEDNAGNSARGAA